ncbi:MAG: class I SAM-dependent methyltransferase [Proteobacteria bacterium]|nr:class I SAM-dependent methyltransferase [Pseudomonadota bacterium]
MWKNPAVPISTQLKSLLNTGLRPANLKVGTLVAERRETARLDALAAAGYFERPAFPLPACFSAAESHLVFDNLAQHRARFDSFAEQQANEAGYSFANDYFTSPDTEVLYTLVRLLRPGTVLEIGSGNSTRITRQAIRDGGLATKLISIDPYPRHEVAAICDESFREPVESSGARERLLALRAGDILFIDSSHELKVGNDVAYLFCDILPRLPAGVVVHIHDVVLPFDYPAEWIRQNCWAWAEQYLVQTMLAFGDSFAAIWPGYYLQRTRKDFAAHFPHLNGREAYSLWLRKVK